MPQRAPFSFLGPYAQSFYVITHILYIEYGAHREGREGASAWTARFGAAAWFRRKAPGTGCGTK